MHAIGCKQAFINIFFLNTIALAAAKPFGGYLITLDNLAQVFSHYLSRNSSSK